MYRRDFGILLLSAFAVYYAMQHEGPFVFSKAWCAICFRTCLPTRSLKNLCTQI